MSESDYIVDVEPDIASEYCNEEEDGDEEDDEEEEDDEYLPDPEAS
ncbi:hypothetical protein [Chroococcidiopsis sp.]